MENVNEKIQLDGISQHGKNRIREHGGIWTVVRRSSSVTCLESEPGVFVRSSKTGDTRWIKSVNDPHFKVRV